MDAGSDRRKALRRRFNALAIHWRTDRRATLPVHDAEQLERIAAYARSGYFHMGQTVDMFVYTPEIPL